MPIVGEITMDTRTYRAALRILSKTYSRTLRIVGTTLAAAGIALLVIGSSGVAMLGASSAVAGVIVAAFLPSRTLSLLIRRAAPTLAAPWRYEIREDAIRLATPLAMSEWRWVAITAVEERPEFWLLRTGMKGSAVVVPKRAFSEADQLTLAHLIHMNAPVWPGAR